MATSSDGSAVTTSRRVSGHSTGRFAGRNPVSLLPRTMVGATTALVLLGVSLTVMGGPLFELSDQAAQQMLERTPYIDAVLGEGATEAAGATP